jgi:predicted kinase
MPAAIVRSDQVRRSMSHGTPGVAAFDEGPYSEQERDQVYDEMLRRAERYLDAGVSVVLDATFFTRSLRERARTIAASRGAQFLVVETIASDAVIHERLDARGQGQSLSDARWETYLAQRERFEPINELAAGEHIRLDSSDDLVRLVDRAMGGLLPASDGGRPV